MQAPGIKNSAKQLGKERGKEFPTNKMYKTKIPIKNYTTDGKGEPYRWFRNRWKPSTNRERM